MRNPTHTSWIQMRQRCLNRRHKNFADYGGRGITICARWDTFDAFLADMGERPAGTTLERKKVNEGYSPENCCWASRAAQSRNRRDTVMLTRDGDTRPLWEWAELLGLKTITIHMRLRRGCSHEQALLPSTPHGQVRKTNRMITFRGETRPLFEWATILGIPRKVLTLRLFNGWTVERAFTQSLTRS